jgi:crotonobetaine/carnitine-CoA ligase
MLSSDNVLPVLLARRAEQQPEAPYVVNAETSAVWTYANADADADRWAAAFRHWGLAAGEPALTMLPPCTEAIAAWIGLSRLRAFEVPINTDYVGRMLRYVIEDSTARVMVAHSDYLRAVEAAAGAQTLDTVVVVGVPGELPASSLNIVPAEDFLAAQTGAIDARLPAPTGRDIATIIYTSGTTGPSKGVMVTWRQAELTATAIMPPELFAAADTFYSPFPMFHVSAKGPIYAAALVGARVVLRKRFDTGAFWRDVRDFGATTTILLGAMANFLYQQPEKTDDADSPLRDAVLVPLIADTEGFSKRFGLRARTTFNMTETCCCIRSEGYHLADPASCGRVRHGFAARVVDADDVEVPPGQLGELVLRGDEPWTLMAGYWRKPEATVNAWRNQWLHTGDQFTCDADGNFYFVDRMKDAIRRRGENISSFEVEAEVNSHSEVLESAAVAVPSEHGEDEVKIVVVPQPGHQLDPAELVGYLSTRMAKFAVPRYVEIVEELPKTPTQKIRKVELRTAGVTSTTWDRLSGSGSAERRPAQPYIPR